MIDFRRRGLQLPVEFGGLCLQKGDIIKEVGDSATFLLTFPFQIIYLIAYAGINIYAVN